MLAEKIDVCAFWVWFIENYPKGIEIMRLRPDFQYKFDVANGQTICLIIKQVSLLSNG